jgi:type II secretory pathway pseudopilin PulG
MHLRGQERFVNGFSRARAQAGYAMAALLVMMSIMAIMMSVAMPIWKTVVKREREEELIWRGNQYVRAINLFRRKYANTYPPNIDILLNERFLRRKYADPMTKDGEFQLIYAAQQASQTPGPPGAVGGSQTPGQVTPAPAPAPLNPLDQSTQGPAGARGGIMGVVSKSTDRSMRLFNGRGKYNEWAFTAQVTAGPGGPAGAGGGPGSRTPGGPGGPAGPATPRPGPGASRPPSFPGFPQPGQPRPRPPG